MPESNTKALIKQMIENKKTHISSDYEEMIVKITEPLIEYAKTKLQPGEWIMYAAFLRVTIMKAGEKEKDQPKGVPITVFTNRRVIVCYHYGFLGGPKASSVIKKFDKTFYFAMNYFPKATLLEGISFRLIQEHMQKNDYFSNHITLVGDGNYGVDFTVPRNVATQGSDYDSDVEASKKALAREFITGAVEYSRKVVDESGLSAAEHILESEASCRVMDEAEKILF